MRNLLLGLVLANLLLLAWQVWVEPAPAPVLASDEPGLTLYEGGSAPRPPDFPAPAAETAVTAATAGAAVPDSCLRVGPLPDAAASQQAARSLAVRGIDATPVARDAQVWLGHWVQIAGFDSVPAAEAARARLVAGGIADALLMQDGPLPMLSLGVFRERERADRVARAAQQLGFPVALRDRYRPGVEQWLLVRPRPGQTLQPAELGLAGDRIMRAEPAPCDNAVSPAEAVPGPDSPGEPVPGRSD